MHSRYKDQPVYDFLKETKKANNIDEVPGVYVIHNRDTAETYIGSTVDLEGRLKNHHYLLDCGKAGRVDNKSKSKKHSNLRFQEAYIRNSNFVFNAVPLNNREEAIDVEQALIDEHWGNPLLLNLSSNARSGVYERTQETKDKISAANSLRVVTEETKEKLRDYRTGLSPSVETKEKIRTAMIGREVSEDTRQKLRESRIGVSRPEHVQAILNKANQEKSIAVVVDDVRYTSVNAAAKTFGVDNRTVTARCNSVTGRFNNWKFEE